MTDTMRVPEDHAHRERPALPCCCVTRKGLRRDMNNVTLSQIQPIIHSLTYWFVVKGSSLVLPALQLYISTFL